MAENSNGLGSCGKGKGGVSKDQPTSTEKQADPGDLSSHAKSASKEALENAIKQSQDPKVREAAHLELKRREHEEEGKLPKKEKGGENPGQDKDHPEHNPTSDKKEKISSISEEDLSTLKDWSLDNDLKLNKVKKEWLNSKENYKNIQEYIDEVDKNRDYEFLQ